jgi:hypothetical protein
LRPPFGEERFAINAQGQVVLELRRPQANGTTALVFEPAAFLERLEAAALSVGCRLLDRLIWRRHAGLPAGPSCQRA